MALVTRRIHELYEKSVLAADRKPSVHSNAKTFNTGPVADPEICPWGRV